MRVSQAGRRYAGGRDMRRSGILMPVSSLPSEYGIGAFSKEAYEFVDFLEQAGQKLWRYSRWDRLATGTPRTSLFHLCRQSLFH